MGKEVRSFTYEGAFLLIFFWTLIPSFLLHLLITRSVPESIGFGLFFSIIFALFLGHQYKGMNIVVKGKDKEKIGSSLEKVKYSLVEQDGNVRRYSRRSFSGFLSPNIFVVDNSEIIGPTMWVKKIEKELL